MSSRFRFRKVAPAFGRWRASVTVITSLIALAALPGCRQEMTGGAGAGADPLAGSGAYAGPLARFNHLHNDAFQKNAEDALAAFPSQQTLLDPAIQKNLDALRAVEVTTLSKELGVAETAFAAVTTDITWRQLRGKLYADLGLKKPGDDPTNTEDDPRETDDNRLLRARIARRQSDLAAVADVLNLIVDAQAVLAEQAAQDLEKAKKNFEDARADAKKTPVGDAPDSPAPDANAPKPKTDADKKAAKAKADQQRDELRKKRVQWAEGLLRAAVDAGRAARDSEKVRVEGTAKQKELLAAIEGSRDPASAYALVAIVGTGLDTESLALLETYVAELHARLEALRPLELAVKGINGAPRKGAADSAPDSDAAPRETTDQAYLYAITSLKRAYAVSGGGRNRAGAADARGEAPGPAKPKRIFEQTLAAQKSIVAGAPNDRQLPDVLKTRVKRLQANPNISSPQRAVLDLIADNPAGAGQTRRAPHFSLTKMGANDNLSDAETSRVAAQSVRAYLVASTVGLAGTGGDYKSSVRQGRAAVEAIPRGRESFESAAAAADSRGDVPFKNAKAAARSESIADDPATQKGVEFLKDLLAGNPTASSALLDRIGAKGAAKEALEAEANKLPLEKIRTKDLQFIGSVVNGTVQLGNDARVRVYGFWRDLLQIQVGLDEENARHAHALITIATLELNRWVKLGDLNEDYAQVFEDQTPKPYSLEQDKADKRPPLFAGLTDLTKAEADLKAAVDARREAGAILKGRAAPDPSADLPHPPIAPDDRVLISIRALAQTAKAWHLAHQSTDDPLGGNLTASNDRLFQAVRTLQGHLLMVSLNAHLAGEDRIRLTSELASHDFHLDSFHGQVEEAGFRLTLGDLKAFHSSGITEADIRALGDAALFYLVSRR